MKIFETFDSQQENLFLIFITPFFSVLFSAPKNAIKCTIILRFKLIFNIEPKTGLRPFVNTGPGDL